MRMRGDTVQDDTHDDTPDDGPDDGPDRASTATAHAPVAAVLADPLRAQLVDLLAQGPACTCHLVADTGAKQPTVSHHLRVLRDAGLVVAEPRGRFTYYRLMPDRLLSGARTLAGLAARARATHDDLREC